jgi:hypothetical protein
MSGKLNLKNLTTEEKEKLKGYINSVKEIKKEIGKLLEKSRAQEMQEYGGDMMNKTLNI